MNGQPAAKEAPVVERDRPKSEFPTVMISELRKENETLGKMISVLRKENETLRAELARVNSVLDELLDT